MESLPLAPSQHQVAITDCKILNVKVYRDRAEVLRSYSLSVEVLNRVGELELHIENLTMSADPESIRVKGMSNGCQILEVLICYIICDLQSPTHFVF